MPIRLGRLMAWWTPTWALIKSRAVCGGIGFALGVLAMFLISVSSCGEDGPRGGDTLPDTIQGRTEDYEREVEDVREEVETDPADADGMRATIAQLRETIRGLERRGPRVVVEYRDRFVPAPPTGVTDAGAVDRGGRLTLWTLTPVDSVPGMFMPRRLDDIDVRDCDDGWRFTSTGVICDRPRFGHVEVHGRVAGLWDGRTSSDVAYGAEGAAGLTWEPTFRSAFRVEVERVGRWLVDPATDTGELEWWWRAGVRTGVRLF